MFLPPGFELCKEYGQFISVLHLHENDGTKDEHKTLTVGSPIFNRLKNDLQYIDSSVVLASEARVHVNYWRPYLQKDLESLVELNKSLTQMISFIIKLILMAVVKIY